MFLLGFGFFFLCVSTKLSTSFTPVLPESLSPCLTCCHLNWCRLAWPRRALSPGADGACPWSGCWAIIGMSLFRHVPMAQLANQLDIPVTRRPAVCRPQRLHPGAPKLADQAVRQVFQQTATLWHQLCQHPTWAGLCSCWPDGVVWRTPDTSGQCRRLCQVENRPGETQYPQVRMLCQMELTSHLLTQTVMDSLCGKRDGVGRATD